MSKRLSLLLVSSLALTLVFPLAVFATAAPKIDPIKSPVDANKQIITGTSEPNASIEVTGGPSMIAPIKADNKGKFEITVALAQNNKNTFFITAKGKDGKKSEKVTVEIVENAEEAKKLQEEQNIDNIAPEKPTAGKITSPLDADEYEITGTAEANSTIEVTGDDSTSAVVDKDGKFSVKVSLKQNKENNFSLISIDAGNNASPGLKITIQEKGKVEKSEEKKQPEVEVAPPFTDVTGHWGEPYIEQLRLKGIVKGYSDGTFGPNTNITRAELTKIALVSFNREIIDKVETKPFNDVDLGIWFTSYINSAKIQNVVRGYDDDTFRPQAYINRAEALKILLDAALINVQTETQNADFTDVQEGVWFEPYSSFAGVNGIIQGYEDKTFRPGNNITRAEVAVMAIKIMEYLKKPTI